MREYTGFARVYELFMDNIPYDDWAEYLIGLLREHGVRPVAGGPGAEKPIVAELGCGTGSMTRRLRAAGYDMIGIDMSAEMLQIAREHEKDNDDSILYLLQDMREFELYGTVAALVSVCDSMNYLLEEDDLLQVFKLAHNYLDPGGVFIFDLHTEYYYKKVLGERTICENRRQGSFIWDNYYDEEEHINEFDMTIYYRADMDAEEETLTDGTPTDDAADAGSEAEGYADDGAGAGSESEGYAEDADDADYDDGALYTRCHELHYQRAWKIDEVKKLIAESGLKLENIYGEGSREEPGRTAERIYFVVSRPE